MIREFISQYRPSFITAIVYMLQKSEYDRLSYIRWLKRTQNFDTVMRRGALVFTKKVKLLLTYLYVLSSFLILASGLTLYVAITTQSLVLYIAAFLIILVYPYILSYSVILLLEVGEALIQRPKIKTAAREARETISSIKAIKIAIAGSFGKTSFKEMLKTILEQGKNVAATPKNMNTVLGTAKFVQQLNGQEEVIIFELGESHKGDVAELSAITQPDLGIITGINEAHLSTFQNIENTVATIFELQDFLGDKTLYKNKESHYVARKIKRDDPFLYSREGVNGWKISDVEISIRGTKFQATKKGKIVWADSKLLGAHQLGPLVACIDIADSLGLTIGQIADGIKETHPYEHRMYPRHVNGAWIIDDTYNGNIQGVEVGLQFLSSLEATRRIYITPGLVEQGDQTQNIHERIGKMIAETADVIVLMKNSVTKHIEKGIKDKNFKGEILIVDDPLNFYTNINSFVAAGDIVLMQNDWTDNYA